ncbi:MAG: hypothetical protein K0R62_5345 [Nonomuraea muscovyensis]|nr:hypothetical protein [Nonomuraea muscovyensis]
MSATPPLCGGIEAGGTKRVCAVADAQASGGAEPAPSHE